MAVVVFGVRQEPEDQAIRDKWRAFDQAKREFMAAERQAEYVNEVRAQRYLKQIADNFVFREEHLTLLRRMEFRLVERSDLACVSASGKYPFGNGDWVSDIYLILGWEAEYDHDGMTAASRSRAADIMAELPHALNWIVKHYQEGQIT